MQSDMTSNYNLALVSIIIPAYNTAPYIHKAINSCLNQTYKKIEVIVVDDGSTDDTLKVAQSYAEKDNRIRVCHQENRGVSSARNYGIREARGKYLVFLDSDDWLEDGAVKILLAAQMEHPDKLIVSNFYSVNEDFSRRIYAEDFTQSENYSLTDIAMSYSGMGRTPPIFHCVWSKIYDTDIVRQGGGIEFPEGISLSEDAVFVVRYLHRVDGAFAINTPLYNMYNRPGSAERVSYRPRMLEAQMKAHELMINHPNNTPELRKFFSISRTHIILSYTDGGMNGRIKGMSLSEIRNMQTILKNNAREYVSCRGISLGQKISFLRTIYLPARINRAIRTSLRKLKGKVKHLFMRR